MVKGHFNTTLDTVLQIELQDRWVMMVKSGANLPCTFMKNSFESLAEHGQKILDDYSYLRHKTEHRIA